MKLALVKQQKGCGYVLRKSAQQSEGLSPQIYERASTSKQSKDLRFMLDKLMGFTK